ncbi:aminoglycoside phosphotransferase family protein [Streptomyces sp. NPDC096132]|uniref:aminoglycoside phosphotransferase family protein n=1 Tax=Streptomyces sp. NPDC096132 TaxID=3366075 RepID=UPI0038217651
MPDPLVPRHRPGERAAYDQHDTVYQAFASAARQAGVVSSGHHNLNYVLPLTEPVARLVGREVGTPVTVRIRRPDVLPVVIRTWQDEATVLKAVQSVLPQVSKCLVTEPSFAIHSYVEGVPLSLVCGNGKPVDSLLIGELAELLARMTQVRLAALPPLPGEWPASRTDSQGFLRTLARLADAQIRQPNRKVFGGLFNTLGVPDDALIGLAERVPAMARRPYSLLHADLHRDNLIVSYDGDPPLICVDWELATYGDPLHDLATHLVRMQYPAHQWSEVVDAWAESMLDFQPAATNGLVRDLRHYISFERAQSLYPDVMRAARSLEESFTQKSLDGATAEVRRALEAAAEPLRLRDVPDREEIEGALYRWLASRTNGNISGRDWIGPAIAWTRDRRVPEHPKFPASAVKQALLAEGAAPAENVFKGTAHLNTVVRVSDYPEPVVVRRLLSNVQRREPSILSEHAVLRAIEKSRVKVEAPRILALGMSYTKDPFAIHTYIGSRRGGPPEHPVNGLRPREADALVDQLCALTKVNHSLVDPVSGSDGFYAWLRDQLVGLVQMLPKESMQLARTLGLPDHQRLGEILSRHEVTHRAPALLHGDLNPWNLVRGGRFLLTIIDWEMALVGDPLYDLVRHMHLTPTRPEIRDRMFRRWERNMPPEYSTNWRLDWAKYRWIEIIRSAYVDLDRLVTRAGLDAPNVRRAVDSYAETLAAATAALGLPTARTTNPYLELALARVQS